MCKPEYHRNNFYRNTFCVFDVVEKEFDKFHYISRKGSAYCFTSEGIFRKSNHWGRVGNCRWKLAGNNKMQNQHIGYASWDSFYPNSENEAVFYIQKSVNGYDYNHYLSPQYDGKAVLRTAKEIRIALKKIKDLDTPDWIKYYPQLILSQELKTDIIQQVIYTPKTFRDILKTFLKPHL